MKRNGIKKIYVLLAALFAGLWLAACTSSVQQSESKDDMEFTVVSEDRLPEELKEIVEEKKGSAFKLTYADEGYLYICIGYGKQDSGGYSIRVESLYATGQVVHVQTTLEGPATREEQKGDSSCPTIVLKLEARENASVVFEG